MKKLLSIFMLVIFQVCSIALVCFACPTNFSSDKKNPSPPPPPRDVISQQFIQSINNAFEANVINQNQKTIILSTLDAIQVSRERLMQDFMQNDLNQLVESGIVTDAQAANASIVMQAIHENMPQGQPPQGQPPQGQPPQGQPPQGQPPNNDIANVVNVLVAQGDITEQQVVDSRAVMTALHRQKMERRHINMLERDINQLVIDGLLEKDSAMESIQILKTIYQSGCIKTQPAS